MKVTDFINKLDEEDFNLLKNCDSILQARHALLNRHIELIDTKIVCQSELKGKRTCIFPRKCKKCNKQ